MADFKNFKFPGRIVIYLIGIVGLLGVIIGIILAVKAIGIVLHIAALAVDIVILYILYWIYRRGAVREYPKTVLLLIAVLFVVTVVGFM